MKVKHLFQVLVLLAILFSALGTAQQAQAQSGTVQIVMRSLTIWDSIYTGYVSPTLYEKWPLNLTEAHDFTVTVTPTSTGLIPLVYLLNETSGEITHATGTLTHSLPAGNYFLQIQPDASTSGPYSLTIRETQPATPTPTPTVTVTPTPTETVTPTPTPVVASVTVTLNPGSIELGGNATAVVSLNHVPAEGYTSAEFTCTYDHTFVEVSNITANTDEFGADPAVAINGPQNGSFILAIAGSNGNKAVADGAVFTFNLLGLQEGQTPVECQARVSRGNNTLTSIDYTGATLTITPVVVNGTLAGTVLASKLVTVRLLNAEQTEVASVTANTDGTFSLSAPSGSYTVTANAEGFLGARGTATLIKGVTTTAQTVTLPAGDIDGNGVIDQLDAMTIGMNYNLPIPAAADLNNDANINVLDLELLASNYRLTGPLNWIIPAG